MMMLDTLSMHDLGLAAAVCLAIVAVYDICYVWPLHRRMSAVAQRCADLERSLALTREEMAAKVAATDNRERDDVGRLGERLGQLELATEARSYEQAIGHAERGEDSMRLISCFGLTEAEAELVTLLHGNAARRAEFVGPG
jgi:hypothetical protein